MAKYTCSNCKESFTAQEWHIATYKFYFVEEGDTVNLEKGAESLSSKLNNSSKDEGVFCCPGCNEELEGFEIKKGRE